MNAFRSAVPGEALGTGLAVGSAVADGEAPGEPAADGEADALGSAEAVALAAPLDAAGVGVVGAALVALAVALMVLPAPPGTAALEEAVGAAGPGAPGSAVPGAPGKQAVRPSDREAAERVARSMR
ncbi:MULTISPECIES: hypothetical protein [Actinomyces]|uniref:hypothetical protein n=1 Tax=Actinomyces TaxID=1654 RepID=UPI0012FE5975|nr:MULTISPECIES: hypothetical protein [Actinomyces]